MGLRKEIGGTSQRGRSDRENTKLVPGFVGVTVQGGKAGCWMAEGLEGKKQDQLIIEIKSKRKILIDPGFPMSR